MKAGKVFFEAKNKTNHFEQVMKEFQSINGLSDRMKRAQHQRFERILATTCKTISSKTDQERWGDPTIYIGVLLFFTTLQIPRAEGCRWRILEIEDSSSSKFSG